jgi:hypothetical protein
MHLRLSIVIALRAVYRDEQYMGLPAHSVHCLLEADPTLAIGEVDCQNAFNAINKEPILYPTISFMIREPGLQTDSF